MENFMEKIQRVSKMEILSNGFGKNFNQTEKKSSKEDAEKFCFSVLFEDAVNKLEEEEMEK